MDTFVIAGFPGTGKSYCSQNFTSMKFLNVDHSTDNYIQYIKSNINKYDVIFISADEDILKNLNNHHIRFITVFPALNHKHEYINRYKVRNDPQEFIKKISDNWTMWILNLIDNHKYEYMKKYIFLNPSQTLYDSLSDILIKYEFWCN